MFFPGLEDEPMRKAGIVVAAVVALAFGASCAKKATPAECKASCQKQAGFAEPAKPAEDPIKKVQIDFETKIKALQKEQLAAITVIDQELQGKLAEAKKDAEKTALGEEYKAKKSEKAKEFAPRFTELNKLKADGIKAAEEAKAKAEADAKAAAEKALQDCADKCVKDRTAKAKVDCQLKAKTLEEFGGCK